MSQPWTYERYWNVVFGARTPRDVVAEYGTEGYWGAAFEISQPHTTASDLDHWIGFVQAEAWMQAGEGGDQPAEWTEHRERALAELSAALEAKP